MFLNKFDIADTFFKVLAFVINYAVFKYLANFSIEDSCIIAMLLVISSQISVMNK